MLRNCERTKVAEKDGPDGFHLHVGELLAHALMPASAKANVAKLSLLVLGILADEAIRVVAARVMRPHEHCTQETHVSGFLKTSGMR